MSKLAKLYNTQYNFLRNAQMSLLSTCPHLLTAVSHPTCLLSKPGQERAHSCPSVRHAKVGEGSEVCSQVLREARCCEHEGQTTSVDVLILETPAICHGACDCVTSLHFVLKIFGHHG